jgi:hypothetical protein
MKELSSVQKLDAVLNFIKDNKVVLKRNLIEEMSNIGITRIEVGRICYRLIRDNNILEHISDRDNKMPFYVATFHGFLFIGYEKKYGRDVTLNRPTRIRILLYGTAAVGAYGLFEIAKWLFHHEGWKVFF